MITAFRLSDALRCVLVNAPGMENLAAPTESVVRCRPLRNSTFWRQSLMHKSERVTVGDWNGIDLSSLASARVRNGVRAWEVDRLHVKDPGEILDLLDQIVRSAGAKGAEKIFLRLESSGETVDLARRAGFYPYYEEVHLTGKGTATQGIPGENGNRYTVDRRTPSDTHGLFQLYCAATPPKVRDGIGVTFDQWWSAQEQPQAKRDEAVISRDGKIVGWNMREPFGPVAAGQVLAHPDFPEVMRRLMEMPQTTQTSEWLVPSYQENAVESLVRQGLKEAGRYTMLIKTVTVPVVNRELSYVEA
ncbi:MAG: hypothetical protein CL759_00265 [Chloroflexi bacterium]|nr:hypothetical protein [Chloroflexota bacterium]